MKILMLSTTDIGGGAARSAYRLHHGLQTIGLKSQMLVQAKESDDSSIVSSRSIFSKVVTKLKLTEHIDPLPLKLHRHKSSALFSSQWLPDSITPAVAKLNPDIINLHWVCKGYLRIETLKQFKQPIVWTLHDMWAFTGGCHYTGGCDRYIQSCGACPQLQSQQEHDISRWNWRRKAEAWQALNLTIVTPSTWLAKCAQSSSLFKNNRIEVIPNGLDLQTYQPIDRFVARDRLKLPTNKQLILFGAMQSTSDPRKGFHLLQAALQKLEATEWGDRVELVVFGASQPNSQLDFSFKSHYIGSLSDDISLSLVYAAVDVFVAPSIQDNLPNTLMEALACGTPCVGFKVGGIPDLVEHQKTGYLVQPFEVDDLAEGIVWVLENQSRHQNLRNNAREKAAQEFSQELQAQRYQAVFGDLLQGISNRKPFQPLIKSS